MPHISSGCFPVRVYGFPAGPVCRLTDTFANYNDLLSGFSDQAKVTFRKSICTTIGRCPLAPVEYDKHNQSAPFRVLDVLAVFRLNPVLPVGEFSSQDRNSR